MRIPWSRLGPVEKPGTYPVPSLGIVHVDQKMLDAIKRIGDNPWIDVMMKPSSAPEAEGVRYNGRPSWAESLTWSAKYLVEY